MPRSREGFKLGYGYANTDPGYTDSWFGVRSGETNPDGEPKENSTSVVRLAGGYKTSAASDYEAFPAGRSQGELFNWKHPQIKGLYRGDNSPKTDLAAALGMAAAESKKRWGVEPVEDDSLTSNSADVTKKLTGRAHRPNYKAGYDQSDLRSYGNHTSTWIDDMAKQSPTNSGNGRDVTILPNSDIEEGSNLIRNKLASLRKANTETSKNIMPQESRVSPFKQEALPLEWN